MLNLGAVLYYHPELLVWRERFCLADRAYYSTVYYILLSCQTGMLKFALICYTVKCTWKLAGWRSEIWDLKPEKERTRRRVVLERRGGETEGDTEREGDVGGQPASCDRGRWSTSVQLGASPSPESQGRRDRPASGPGEITLFKQMKCEHCLPYANKPHLISSLPVVQF